MELVLLKHSFNNWSIVITLAIVLVVFVGCHIWVLLRSKHPSDQPCAFPPIVLLIESLCLVAFLGWTYMAYHNPVEITYKVATKTDIPKYSCRGYEFVQSIPSDSCCFYTAKYGLAADCCAADGFSFYKLFSKL